MPETEVDIKPLEFYKAKCNPEYARGGCKVQFRKFFENHYIETEIKLEDDVVPGKNHESKEMFLKGLMEGAIAKRSRYRKG